MKTGIYGGTFNPIHLGHMQAAAFAAKELGLEQLVLIPAGIPPHKAMAQDSPESCHRLAMTQLAAERVQLETGIPVVVSDMEINREGKSFTSDTLTIWKEEHPDDELVLFMGTDMLTTFTEWHEPQTIAALAQICSFARGAEDKAALLAAKAVVESQYEGAQVTVLDLPEIVEISSSELRESLAAGRGREYLDGAVYGYILRMGLYGTCADLKNLSFEDLRAVSMSFLKAKRVRHVMGTEEEAVRLARMYGVDETDARVAALLHDCTKKLDMDEQLGLCELYGLELDELEKVTLKLLHAKTGAAVARDLFGVKPEVYEAILWHTTGKADMTPLQKVIYLADYIEPNRKFPGVDALRETVYRDMDAGLMMGLSMTVEEMNGYGTPIHSKTMEALEYLKGTYHE